MARCWICSRRAEHTILRLPGPALTSGMTHLEADTAVYYCRSCDHCFSPTLPDAARFYASNYKISLQSPDHDQIYGTRDGEPVFRTEVQAQTVLKTLSLAHGARVLDLGCGKATTLRKMKIARPDIKPMVFDVSDDYRTSWQDWILPEDMATFELPSTWTGTIDLVMAHYVLEHVHELGTLLEDVRRILNPAGSFFFSVPDWRQNPGDFLVVDHVNHFSSTSIQSLLDGHDFELMSADDGRLPAAFAVVAKPRQTSFRPDKSQSRIAHERPSRLAEAEAAGALWDRRTERLVCAAQGYAGRRVSVYGAGFYGAFIATHIKGLLTIERFIDSNPHLAGTELFGIPVVLPRNSTTNEVIFVGLNPLRARELASTIPILSQPGTTLVFLD